jgi:uncharacterized membrane protein
LHIVRSVRNRSDWIWASRWRQGYFVVATVAVAALIGLVLDGRIVVEFVVLAAAGAVAGLALGSRRRR